MKAASPHASAVAGPVSVRSDRDGAWWCVIALLVAVTAIAYCRSFDGAFVFDDLSAIGDNPTIRHLWPIGPVLMPPVAGGETVGGRPLLNLSLALNYAISGTNVWSYHAFNLAVHMGAALLLFGLVRRTLLTPVLRPRFAASATVIATLIAAVWSVHPLQTESVVYVVQRAESMMGFFYLLTLYAFVRGAHSGGAPKAWWVLSLAACLAGMGTKEVMITAPVIVFLYDRTFLAGTFGESWRRRKGVHLALAATWLLLVALMLTTGGNRGGTKGFGLGIAWWEFPLTQFYALVHYLRLAFWPAPLAFEYERYWVTQVSDVAADATIILALGLAALVALRRWPVLGFLGVWFFGILAPSSAAPGASQMIAEHRMYLPLAAVIAFVVVVTWQWLGKKTIVVLALAALAEMAVTVNRTLDYHSAITLWTDTIAKRPLNGVAHGQLAAALLADGQVEPAIAEYEEAIRLEQLSTSVFQRNLVAELMVNYGNALVAAGRTDDAITAYRAALHQDPQQKLAAFNLGSVLLERGKTEEARSELERALAIDATYAPAQTNLGSLELRAGHTDAAIRHYETAAGLQPESGKAEANLGNALLVAGRSADAIVHLERAVSLQPDLAIAHEFLGDALDAAGRRAEAVRRYEEALALNPSDPVLLQKRRRLSP